MILLKIFSELFLRLYSILFYPLSYLLQEKIRSTEILWQNYLYKWKNFCFIFWIILNDSETFSYQYGIPIGAGYYPKWLYNACYQLDTKWKRFAMAYWFNGIRNSMVNFNNYMMMITGEYCGYD